MRYWLLLCCCFLISPCSLSAQVAKVTARGQVCGVLQCRIAVQQGTCFHIGTDGRLDYFLTVGHLLRGLSDPTVQISLDAGLQQAQVIASSQEPDLALLALPQAADRQPFPLARDIQPGTALICVGYSPGHNYRLSRGTLLRLEASDQTLWTSCPANSGDSGGLIGAADTRSALGIIVWGPQAAGYDARFIRQWITAQGITLLEHDIQKQRSEDKPPIPIDKTPSPTEGTRNIPAAPLLPSVTEPPADLFDKLAALLGVAVPVAGVLTGIAGTGGAAAIVIPLLRWYWRRRSAGAHRKSTTAGASAKTTGTDTELLQRLRSLLQQASASSTPPAQTQTAGPQVVQAPSQTPAPTPEPAPPPQPSPSTVPPPTPDQTPAHTCCQGTREEGVTPVAPFPRALDEARELLALRQSEGRVAALDALRGMFFDDEVAKAQQRADPTESTLLRRLRESIDQRVSEVAPYSTSGF